MPNRRLRRTELATPAVSQKMMIKGLLETEADEVFFDLEASVPDSHKEVARKNVVEVLQKIDKPKKKTVAFRINSVETPFWHDDLQKIIRHVGEKIDCVIVPKVNRSSDVQIVEKALETLENESGIDAPIGLEVIIETAEGLLRCGEIAFSSDRIESFIFGPGDYAASIGMSSLVIGGHVEEYPGHIWYYPLFTIRNASAAAGIQAIDGPYALYSDLEGFEKSAKTSRSLGFDGKWVIHPSQIGPCNRIYTPTKEEIEKARKIVEAYEKAVAQGLGAISVDGIMVDDATIKIAQRIFDLAKLLESS
ncbi:MAG: CoA ester lyase [Candidatus Caldarchaeum sp.]|nr:CoA ester lyase [Candidatus Caldarchaeum sp.]